MRPRFAIHELSEEGCRTTALAAGMHVLLSPKSKWSRCPDSRRLARQAVSPFFFSTNSQPSTPTAFAQLDPLRPYQFSSSMSYHNQPHILPPFDGDQLAQQITLTPDDVVFLREHGLHLNTQDNVGSFEFADLMHSGPAPQEPFSLTHRPDEDIFRVPPQEQSASLYSYQHMYNPEGYQNNRSFVPAYATPSVPSMPIQTQQGSAPYGDAYSIPRAAWPSSNGAGYAITAPAPSTTLDHSDMTGAQDFTLPPVLTSSSSAPYQESYHESPTSCDAIPSYASYSGPNHAAPASWDTIGLPPPPRGNANAAEPADDAVNRAIAGSPTLNARTFGPVQYHQQPGYTNASLRQASSRVQSRRQTRERVAPVVSHTARSGQQGNQTLKDNNKRTREIDLGDRNTTGQSVQRYLIVPSRGPSVPAPAPSAGVSTGSAKVGRAAKAKTSRKRRDLAMPLPYKMPPVPEILVDGKTRYMCPWEGCGKSCARCHDTKRHYWRHVDNRPRWWCTRCDRLYTRSDNAGRHYRKIHTDDKKKAKEDIVQVNGDMTEGA
ncbi:hypothetical protein EVG20_g10805 [Dentipellis fragilis]|uniref:C2H2-type domain-containing protein n=1 Tax=Dentipellis fragilis TaxID=205917 RepID=A0A4Y9XR58_9AGAM|nr:hypothetical protein EVG20_g10805 [Dentipellis fragilis]